MILCILIRSFKMENLIRTAHSFAVASNRFATLGDTSEDIYASVSSALTHMSQKISHAAHLELNQEIDVPSVTSHRIKAGVDLSTNNPGIWIDKVGICTIDATKCPQDKLPRKRRFSPETEKKRADTKMAKLQQELEAADNCEKKPRKSREKKSTCEDGTEICDDNSDAAEDYGPIHCTKICDDNASSEVIHDFDLSEENIPIAINHFERHSMLKVFKYLCRKGKESDKSPMNTSVMIHKLESDALPLSVRKDHTFSRSPVSFVRAYDALTHVDLHPAVRDAFLKCKKGQQIVPTDGVLVEQSTNRSLSRVHAGKHLRRLMELPTNGPRSLRRIYVCATSNEAVDSFWDAMTELKNCKILMLRMTQKGRTLREHECDKVLSKHRGKLLVFGTISGRNAPQLININFDAIVVLDAHIVPEYDTWALMRSSTRHLYLSTVSEPCSEDSFYRRLSIANY